MKETKFTAMMLTIMSIDRGGKSLDAPIGGLLVVLLLSSLAGCDYVERRSLPYAVKGSQLPNLDSDPDGGIVMSWVEPDGDGHRLQFASYKEGDWSKPSTISRGDDWFVNWADFPSVKVIDDQFWVAHWLVKSGWSAYAYDIFISVSKDAGHTWSEPIRPHSDGTPTEHGFASLFPLGSSAGLVWLDGRETLKNTSGDRIVGMTLRSAELTQEGEISESLVDPLVCDCCQTDVAVSLEGPLLVYRDRNQQEVRDISLARYVNGQWHTEGAIAEDNWQVFGCPVNGPAIAAADAHVGVTWYTQGSGSPTVQFARSDDGGLTFDDPVFIDPRNPIGRVDVAVDQSGCAIVSWIGRGDSDAAELNYRYIGINGQLSETHTLAEISATRPNGFPRLARYDRGVVVAWTDLREEKSQVKTAELEFACP